MSNHAAVGHNDLTGDIACRVRSQERDNARNLLRLAEAAERNLFDRAFLNGIRQHLRHIRVNEAGRNRVDCDATRAELLAGGLGHADQAGLGSGIVDLSRVARNAGNPKQY